MPEYKIEIVGPDSKAESYLGICEEAIKNVPFLAVSPKSSQVNDMLVKIKNGDFRQSCMFVLTYKDKPVGFIIGSTTTEHPILGDTKIAYELGWYVTPAHRGNPISMELKRNYEAWAKMAGCRAVCMAHFDDPVGQQLGQLYLNEGYTRAEITYIKEL